MPTEDHIPWTIRSTITHRNTPHAARRWELRGGVRAFGREVRLFFHTKSGAQKRARELHEDFRAHGSRAVELSEVERADAARAFERIRPRGVSLLEAVEFFLRHVPTGEKSCTVREGVLSYLATRGISTAEFEKPGKHRPLEARKDRHAGYSYTHRTNLCYRLRAFVEDFGDEPLGTMSAKRLQLKNWLRLRFQNPTTLKNHRASLHSFFAWAVEQQLLPENPARPWPDLTKRFRDHQRRSRPGILRPDELSAYLQGAQKHEQSLVAYFAIGAFSGVRNEEIGRLRWGMIKDNFITVPSEVAKTGDARDIPLHPTLRRWLAAVPRGKDDDLVVPADFEKRRRLLRAALNKNRRKTPLPWPQNALRHSFGSYRYAEVRNLNQVAEEMRHDDWQTFRRYYLNRGITDAEAKAYWAIAPRRI